MATVARRPCLRQSARHDLRGIGCSVEMQRKSEYFMQLSAQSKDRYECKVLSCGLSIDPYAIEDWTESPEFSPRVDWSDMMLYMVSTPSPHTKETIKASQG